VLREAGASSTFGVLAVEWAEHWLERCSHLRVRIGPSGDDPTRRRVLATASLDAVAEGDLAAWIARRSAG
jgi:hypothetical protein